MGGWIRKTGGGTSFSNESTLLKFGESGGQPTFNGAAIASGTNPSAIDRQTQNLFDVTRVVSGTHHQTSDGTIVSGGYETHAIAVKPGYNYVFNKGDGIATQYTFFDSNGVFISGGSATTAKAPVNAVTMYVYAASTAVANALMVMETNYYYADYTPYTQKYIAAQPVQGWYQSKWFEKTWWVLGDSISTGLGDGAGGGGPYASEPYHYVTARDRNIRVQNDAVSGYTIGNIYDNKVMNMPPSAYAPDLITIMAGTNDHGFNITIGTINDDPTTGTTFYARYRKTIEKLQTLYPYASIGLITPIQRSYASGSTGTDGNNANATGAKLRDYCDAIVAIGKYYGLPILDWYYSTGFSPYNSLQNQNYYCSTTDFTHPNNYGHEKMAALVGNFIETL